MHIAVFGGSGRVGGRFIEFALAEGHTVRALVRDPAKLTPRDGLEIIAGDVLNPADVERCIAGADAVVSGLGGAGVDNPGDAQSQGMRNIVAAMEKLGVRRVLGVAGGGILDSVNGGLRHDQPSFPTVFKKVSNKHKEAWHAMRDSSLDWTMIATGDIVPGERTGVYRTLEDQLPEGGRKISVEDVADFLLRSLRERLHVKKRVGAGY
jgi:putative NADH-flavin reductase